MGRKKWFDMFGDVWYMKSNNVYDDANASKRAADGLVQKSHQR